MKICSKNRAGKYLRAQKQTKFYFVIVFIKINELKEPQKSASDKKLQNWQTHKRQQES